MKERNNLAEACKKNPKTIYYLLDRLYQKNFLDKGREEVKGSSVFLELRIDPGAIIAPQIILEEELGNDLFHAMAKEGYSFLESQNLGDDVKKIVTAWGVPFLKSQKGSNYDPFDNRAFRHRINFFFSTISTPLTEASPNLEESSRENKGNPDGTISSKEENAESPQGDFQGAQWKKLGEKLGWSLVCNKCGAILGRKSSLIQIHYEVSHNGEKFA